MALFGFKAEHTEKLINFMNAVEKKLKSNNLVYNPFNAKVSSYPMITEKKPEIIYILDMTPIYPNFSVIGWFMVFGVLVMAGFSYWIIPGIIISLLGIFWTAEFYYFAFRLGLYKHGYRGEIKRLNHQKIIESLLLR